MISKMNVKFGEELGTMELIQEITNDWDWKFIFNGWFSYGMKVPTRVPSSLFIYDHDH